eukprot:scaffold1396_cov73-Phaeocystis_antarctica.AAC.3
MIICMIFLQFNLKPYIKYRGKSVYTGGDAVGSAFVRALQLLSFDSRLLGRSADDAGRTVTGAPQRCAMVAQELGEQLVPGPQVGGREMPRTLVDMPSRGARRYGGVHAPVRVQLVVRSAEPEVLGQRPVVSYAAPLDQRDGLSGEGDAAPGGTFRANNYPSAAEDLSLALERKEPIEDF